MTYVRTRGESQNPEVTLFPFLAVLLCTMGILIMLLILIGQNTAQKQENAQTRPDAPIGTETVESVKTTGTAESAEISKTAPQPAQPPITEEELFRFDDEPEQTAADAGPSTASPSPDTEQQQKYEEVRASFGDAEVEQLETEIEQADWFKKELESVRDRTAETLKNNRETLAATESQIAEMVARLVELNAEVLTLQQKDPASPDLAALQTEIDQKAALITAMAAEIEEIKKKNESLDGKKSYAILPYKGKSGTFRHPIYIECHAGGICMMPENIPFIPEDFLLAAYPGNPFDSAVRAARQYFIEIGEGSEENEPYPLLIVRPGGADTYYAAREALASWGGVCGYEFVEEGAEIEYPASDPELTRRVEEQIIMARSRLAVPLAALLAEKRRNGTIGGTGTTPGNSGGGMDSGTGSGSGSYTGIEAYPQSGMTPLADQLGPYARLNGPGTAGGSSGSAGAGVPLPDYSGAYAGNIVNPASAPNLSGTGIGGMTAPGTDGTNLSEINSYDNSMTGSINGSAAGAMNESLYGSLSGSETAGGMNSLNGANSANAAAPGNPYQSAQTQAGYAADTPDSALTASVSPQTAASAPAASAVDPREMLGNTAYDQTSADKTPPETSAADFSDAAGASRAPNSKKPKEPEENSKRVAETPLDPKAFNLNEQLRKKTNVAMERPILIECRAGRFVFPAQAGINPAKEIPVSGTADSEILQTIITTVHSWKVAGRNRYWSPWIQASVQPGGEAQYQRLVQLMTSQQVRIERVE